MPTLSAAVAAAGSALSAERVRLALVAKRALEPSSKLAETDPDVGFTLTATNEALEDLNLERVLIAGLQQPGSKRTQRRL